MEAFEKCLITNDTENILTEDEKTIGTDIMIEYKKGLEDFSKFLD